MVLRRSPHSSRLRLLLGALLTVGLNGRAGTMNTGPEEPTKARSGRAPLVLVHLSIVDFPVKHYIAGHESVQGVREDPLKEPDGGVAYSWKI
jgi:hypothetical protein